MRNDGSIRLVCRRVCWHNKWIYYYKIFRNAICRHVHVIAIDTRIKTNAKCLAKMLTVIELLVELPSKALFGYLYVRACVCLQQQVTRSTEHKTLKWNITRVKRSGLCIQHSQTWIVGLDAGKIDFGYSKKKQQQLTDISAILFSLHLGLKIYPLIRLA